MRKIFFYLIGIVLNFSCKAQNDFVAPDSIFLRVCPCVPPPLPPHVNIVDAEGGALRSHAYLVYSKPSILKHIQLISFVILVSIAI